MTSPLSCDLTPSLPGASSSLPAYDVIGPHHYRPPPPGDVTPVLPTHGSIQLYVHMEYISIWTHYIQI
ncbi:hypothetical protein FKM82_025881 [Ascaphus truei]